MKSLLAAAAAVAACLLPASVRAQQPTTRVLLDNPSVRVSLLEFVPGAATGRHQGLEPEIGILLEGELVLDDPSGRQALTPGSPVYWMPGLTPHDLRNESDRPARLWDILLKRCD